MYADESFKQYTKIKNWLVLARALITLLFLFVMAFSFSQQLSSFITSIIGSTIIVVVVYVTILYGVYFLIMLPLSYYEQVVLVKKFEIASPQIRSWFDSLIKKELRIYGVFLIVVQGIYFFIEAHPSVWWVWEAVIWIIIYLVFDQIYPLFIMPLLYEHDKLRDERLLQRIDVSASKTKLRIKDVYVFDFLSRGQRYVMTAGIGRKTLIIDKRLLEYSDEEFDVAVLGEFAKNYFFHPFKLKIINCFLIIIIFSVTGVLFRPACRVFGIKLIFDLATLPVIAGLVLCTVILILPFYNFLCRKFQR